MNKLPNVIYIQLDRTWTPADNCSQLEGSTHNAERIHPSDVKYIRAGVTADMVRAMVTKDKIKAVLKQHFLNHPISYNPLRHLDAVAEAIAALPVDRVRAMAALVRPHVWAKNIFFVPDDKARVCEVDMSEKPPRCECGATRKCEHVQAVELHREQQSDDVNSST